MQELEYALTQTLCDLYDLGNVVNYILSCPSFCLALLLAILLRDFFFYFNNFEQVLTFNVNFIWGL